MSVWQQQHHHQQQHGTQVGCSSESSLTEEEALQSHSGSRMERRDALAVTALAVDDSSRKSIYALALQGRCPCLPPHELQGVVLVVLTARL